MLWYIVPPLAGITEWTGTPGAIMCLFGLALALSAAATEGLVSTPRRCCAALRSAGVPQVGFGGLRLLPGMLHARCALRAAPGPRPCHLAPSRQRASSPPVHRHQL